MQTTPCKCQQLQNASPRTQKRRTVTEVGPGASVTGNPAGPLCKNCCNTPRQFERPRTPCIGHGSSSARGSGLQFIEGEETAGETRSATRHTATAAAIVPSAFIHSYDRLQQTLLWESVTGCLKSSPSSLTPALARSLSVQQAVQICKDGRFCPAKEPRASRSLHLRMRNIGQMLRSRQVFDATNNMVSLSSSSLHY